MNQPQPTSEATRYRVADDTTNPDTEPHLILEHKTVTLCGARVGDPQAIGGTTNADQIPTIEDAENGEICTSCVTRARTQSTGR